MNIGSAWKKTSQAGKSYMSCVIQSPFLPGGEIRFLIFPVDEKKSENAPDYSIVWNLAKPKQDNNQGAFPESDSAKAGAAALSDENVPF